MCDLRCKYYILETALEIDVYFYHKNFDSKSEYALGSFFALNSSIGFHFVSKFSLFILLHFSLFGDLYAVAN